MIETSREQPTRVSAQCLAPEYSHILSWALDNVLSLELTEFTMAQLIDGLPTCSEAWDVRGSLTIQADQNAEPGSIAFNMRLFKVVAAAIHQIAVFLFNIQPKSHSQAEIQATTAWEPPPDYIGEGRNRRLIPRPNLGYRPTSFSHVAYLDYEQYPHGIADVAGYWAEDRIIGGVILFDRGDSGTDASSMRRDVYFHAGRDGETFRVWRPLEDQFNPMLDFLLSENIPELEATPFPMFATDLNRYRYDPCDAMAVHHIFRDSWERRNLAIKPEERDVRSAGDCPEILNMFENIDNALELPTTGSPDPEDRRQELAPEVEIYLQWSRTREDGEADEAIATPDGSKYGEQEPRAHTSSPIGSIHIDDEIDSMSGCFPNPTEELDGEAADRPMTEAPGLVKTDDSNHKL
ncbi:hypothetical protein BJ170DRAFT_735807 [Xylariales sp. AK1849]|nr:hypothetical protein BJ170DRAFT_735807 [Xylariales sp. AK1849]